MNFFIDTIIYVIYSPTQIACDVMCVQYVQKQLPEVSFKKGVLKNFANLTGEHLCWSLFPTSSKDVFLRNLQIFKNTYFEEHLRMTADQMICNKILLEKIRAMFCI